MYGGDDRSSNPILAQADKDLIEGTTREFGSRRAASQAFVEQGLRYYLKDDLGTAMKRFNQAWLIDESDPEVYWGFAVVNHDLGNHCEAKRLIEKGLARGLSDPDALADAGLIFTLCAVSDPSLSQADLQAAFMESDQLYYRSMGAQPNSAGARMNRGYLYSSWARAYCLRGDFAKAWEMIDQAEQYGAELGDQFMGQLNQAMPDPR